MSLQPKDEKPASTAAKRRDVGRSNTVRPCRSARLLVMGGYRSVPDDHPMERNTDSRTLSGF